MTKLAVALAALGVWLVGSGAASPGTVRPHNRPVPILMYHVIGTPPPGTPFPDLYVGREDFALQLAWLHAHGYHAISLRRVYDYWRRGDALPPRPIVLTFDDGYPQDFTRVRPLLAQRHWPGVLNLAVRNLLDGKLTVRQIRLMIRQGWEVDAHTINHIDLTTLGPSALHHEVAGSRTWIRRRFHVPVDFFCYPSGRYNARVISAVRSAGFLGATIEGAGSASPRDGFFTLPRIRVSRSDGVSGLAAKLGG
ncbi:MAG: polysaccharide deacetylase family protein [Gaiellaceae bacterium]